MNIDKAELKMLAAEDIGASVEDTFEAAKKEMINWDGAAKAFAKAAHACAAMAEHVNKDVDAGMYDLETAVIVKRYIDRCSQANLVLQRRAEDSIVAASGKVSALESTMAIIKKYRDVEKMKIASVRIEEVSPGVREVVGDRPGMTIKERRLMEAMEEAKAEVMPENEVAVTAEVTSSPVVEEPKVTVRRRGRPPKIKVTN